MLVLTRRRGQKILIGDDVVVTVLEVKGDQVRLGVDAPRHVSVHREELLAVGEENQAAVLGAQLPALPRPPRRPAARPGAARPPLRRRPTDGPQQPRATGAADDGPPPGPPGPVSGRPGPPPPRPGPPPGAPPRG